MSVEIFQELAQVVIDGDVENAEALAKQAVKLGLDAHACIKEGLIKGFQRAGSLFESDEYLLPGLLNSAEAMESALKILEPAQVVEQDREVISLVVLRPMEGDQHEDGKILIGTMLTDEVITSKQKIPFLQWLL